ncbi:MAG: hypothetical protein EOM69_13390 [Clostridia bacterium]|nr:hypothetical protein [Clostridia bacterium]
MNPNWLWLIIPASVLFGMFITGLCAGVKIGDLAMENARLREDAKDYWDGVCTVPEIDADQIAQAIREHEED